MKELEPLRSLGWDRDDHCSRLEETLMHAHRTRPFVLARSRALLAALVLVLVGAIAGAGSAALVYEWNGLTIKTTEQDDGTTHIEITRDGDKLVDEIIQPGEGAMVTDDGELIIVEPADDEDDSGEKKR